MSTAYLIPATAKKKKKKVNYSNEIYENISKSIQIIIS